LSTGQSIIIIIIIIIVDVVVKNKMYIFVKAKLLQPQKMFAHKTTSRMLRHRDEEQHSMQKEA